MTADIVLRNVTVIDGTGVPPRPDMNIVLHGPIIAAVTHDHVPPGTDDHDLDGLTVLPGFIDAHAHLVFTGSDDPLRDVTGMDDTALYDVAVRNAATALAAGVTTIRDCGSRGLVAHRLRDDIAAGRIAGPRILVAGAPICATGGHLWFMGGALSPAADPAQAVRSRVAEGADHIKVMASGGHMTPGSNARAAELSETDLRAITTTAHELGVRVAAHAHSTEAIIRSVAAGVDTIEHCSWLGTDGFDYRPDVVDSILDQGITVSPTVPAYFRHDPGTMSRDETDVSYMRSLVASRRETTSLMHRLGVPMIIGSDAGCRGIPFDAYADIVPVYTDVFGFTPLQALQAMTFGAAAALGLDGTVGTIKAGMLADLVVLDGDPAANLQSIGLIRHVYQAGHRVT
jgi:imidazolonepropionase-like amidohydrolase